MTLDEFRIKHSTLIEHYQYIEHQLKAIYAILGEKPFYFEMCDVEKDPLSLLMTEIKAQEKKKGVFLIPEELYREIDELRHRRNFWTHDCYYDLPFDLKTGGLKKQRDIDLLARDLWEAGRIRETVFNIYTEYINW